MYRFYINNVDNDYHYDALARVFFGDDNFEVITINRPDADHLVLGDNSYMVNSSASESRDAIKREFYYLLSNLTGMKSDWGTLTGVRPLTIALGLLEKTGSISAMQEELSNKYLVSDEKIQLLTDIAEYQIKYLTGNPSDKSGVYIGVPFCPTRCAYCSFASNVAGADAIERYVVDLLREIKYMGNLVRNNGTLIESLYMGGGTPTTLSSEQLRRVIECARDYLGVDPAKLEFTVEAGRPDTISADKLATLKELGISRISINPQSMKDKTLQIIGRDHSADDIRKGYKLAKDYGFDVINADLIAGLPDENLDDFKASLEEVIKLGANNITVHTLSVKRGSRLRDKDPDYYRHNEEMVADMLRYARRRLSEEGFFPYYIYRQKHQIGALENVGYCKDGKHSIYNIRIMEEKQTIIGLGCGAIGKVYYPEENRLERIPNVYNYEVYSERIDELLERKNKYYE